MRTAASASPVFQYFRRQIETNRRDILHHSARDPSYSRGAWQIWNPCGIAERTAIWVYTSRWVCSALRDFIGKLCSAGRPGIYSNTGTESLETAVKMTSMKRWRSQISSFTRSIRSKLRLMMDLRGLARRAGIRCDGRHARGRHKVRPEIKSSDLKLQIDIKSKLIYWVVLFMAGLLRVGFLRRM